MHARPGFCCPQLTAAPASWLLQAVSLGVPKGPMFGKLSRGESVTVGEGRVVTPEEVMEPSMPGALCCAVLCCVRLADGASCWVAVQGLCRALM